MSRARCSRSPRWATACGSEWARRGRDHRRVGAAARPPPGRGRDRLVQGDRGAAVPPVAAAQECRGGRGVRTPHDTKTEGARDARYDHNFDRAVGVRLDGQVIMPDDVSYDDARTVFYGGIDRKPPRSSAQLARTTSAQRSRSRERPGSSSRSGAAATASRSQHDRGWARARPPRPERAGDRRREPHGLGGRRYHHRPLHGSRRRARSGDAVRRHGRRDRRADVGGGIGFLVRKTVHHRQPARCGRRDRGRTLLHVDADSTRTSSGRSAAAAAISALRPGSSSGSTS